MKVIRKIESTINHSSDGVKGGRHRSASATVTRASADAVFRPNSIRGVINKNTPYAASLVLLPSLAILAMFMVVFMGMPMNVYADDEDDGGIGHSSPQEPSGGTTSNTTNTSSSTTFFIEDEKTIGITLSSGAIVLDIAPTSSGVFKSKSFTVDVSTNNPTGYNLTMTADKTNLSRTSAINGTTPTIPTIPTGKTFTETSFETGYWGYKIGTNTNYLPMTTAAIAINTTEAAANSSVNTITFATRLNNSTPSGTYSGVTLSFVATANEVPVTTNYMQDMTASALASLMPSIGNTATLVDKRDENEYTIAKLADGKYWFLDNLRLDPTTVEISTLIDNTNAGETALTSLKQGGGSSPLASSKVTTSWSATTTVPVVGVAYKEQTATSYGAGSGKIGVYYNYCAASAGSYCPSGDDFTRTEEDICPANWRMPTAFEYRKLCDTLNGSVCATGPGGFSAQSVDSTPMLAAAVIGGEESYANMDATSTSSLQYQLSTPFSGYYEGSQKSKNSYGYFWSTAGTGDYYSYNYYLAVSPTRVNAPQTYNRFSNTTAFNVRCIFKGE